MLKCNKWLLLSSIIGILVLTSCMPAQTPTAQIIPVTVTPPDISPTLPPMDESEPIQITIQDALGRTVVLEKAPERIVLAGKAVIMLADAVYLFPEVGSKIVGISNTNQGRGNFISLLDPTYSEKVSLANDVGPEQIAALQPDLVILKSFLADSLGSPLETLGIPVVYLDFETAEQYQRDLTTLGQVFQNEARAQELITYFDSTVKKVSSATAGMDDAEKPHVLLLYYSEKDGNVAFNVAPRNYMQTFLVETAGGLPVWLDIELGNGWTKVGLEQIAVWDPDQIYVVSYTRNSEDIVAELKADANWQGLSAITTDQVYAFPSDFYSWDQPDVRWALGLQWLATRIQPELWSGVDMLQVTRDFYQKLYGIDEKVFSEQVLPLLTGIE